MGLTAVDRFEIAELLARYSAAVDDGDFAAVGALFAGGELRDAEDRVVAAGAAAVTDLFAATTQRHGSGTPETVHLVTNLVVEPQPDGSAVARSRFLVLQQVG
ncbi:MAG: nuclear transport factor 2 family protein, partial [Acidobacteria bacterium]|nr:nuclear transport factor 2 family protein [Acidobacteriota bacterium]